MSLLDGTSKMSKSDPADGSRINLLDTPAEITKKIKRCKVPLITVERTCFGSRVSGVGSEPRRQR